MARALVLVSGGLDSTVALWWAAGAGYEPVALTVHYPGRPRGELRAMAAILAASPAREVHEVTLPFLQDAEDLDARAGTRDFAGAPEGYIPFRNAILYSVACYHAQALRCGVVVGGHNRDDAQQYPDASARFFADLQSVLDRGAWREGEVKAPALLMPLLALDREQVLVLGEALGAPLQATWSCHEDGEGPCGACPACRRRAPAGRLAA